MSDPRERDVPDWYVFRGIGDPNVRLKRLGDPPPWRRYGSAGLRPQTDLTPPPMTPTEVWRGEKLQVQRAVIEAVNAGLYLRRPLLITGKPGTGKSSLADAVAHDLGLGRVLHWSITSRSTLAEALYRYDAIGRLQAVQLDPGKPPPISPFLRLAPLGTALVPANRPRVLLVDEIDKADIDLPNDLLDVFERGTFEIPELARLDEDVVHVRLHDSDDAVPIRRGRVECRDFPVVIMTNNEEREFPPAFLRRCLRVRMPEPKTPEEIKDVVRAHLDQKAIIETDKLISIFLDRRAASGLANDQLLNAIHLILNAEPTEDEKQRLVDAVLQGFSDETAG
jgi:MoxR-like ATPase